MVEKVAKIRMRLSEASTTRRSPSMRAMIGLRSSAYEAAAVAAIAASDATVTIDLTALAAVVAAASALESEDKADEVMEDHDACEAVGTCDMWSVFG